MRRTEKKPANKPQKTHEPKQANAPHIM